MTITYLLLGTNSGDKSGNLLFARKRIEKLVGRVISTSGIYETEPWGFISEENFYNQALCIETELELVELFEIIFRIEQETGRIRKSTRYTNRSLDIDVLFYGNSIINSENITIPHPRLHLRKFALAPMAEIAPHFLHPVMYKTMVQLLDKCEDESEVRQL